MGRNTRWWSVCLLASLVLGGAVLYVRARGPTERVLTPAARGHFDRGDNAVWLRRFWLHGGDDVDPHRLALELRALRIRRIYPFLGPMDADGWPGWRDDGRIHRYEPARARRFFDAMRSAAPEIRVMPWTGGNLGQDVHLDDARQRAAFAEHAAALVAMGAAGIHLNVEPLPDGTEAYLTLLREVRAAIGPDAVLSVAAYPPTTPLQPSNEIHWSLAFTREVCTIADELAVMSYDTGLRGPDDYEQLVADWTRDLLRTLPTRAHGGCDVLMGVPTYEDDEPYHRPDVENPAHALRGLLRGLSGHAPPRPLDGVAIYASWTTDTSDWGTYERLWLGRAPTGALVHDGP